MQRFNLTPGQRYEVLYQLDNQRYPRRAVMDYLGDRFEGHELDFSARPVAGTQSLPASAILDITVVPKNTPIALNERA